VLVIFRGSFIGLAAAANLFRRRRTRRRPFWRIYACRVRIGVHTKFLVPHLIAHARHIGYITLAHHYLFTEHRLLFKPHPLLRERNANFLGLADTGGRGRCVGNIYPFQNEFFAGDGNFHLLILGDYILAHPHFSARDTVFVDAKDLSKELHAVAR
jgi:hypothetical protein